MNNGITEYFENVKLTKEYDGYFCKISDVITISSTDSHVTVNHTNQPPVMNKTFDNANAEILQRAARIFKSGNLCSCFRAE